MRAAIPSWTAFTKRSTTAAERRAVSNPDQRIQVDTPDLIALRHSAEVLNLRASRIRSLQGQNYLSPFKGRGMEFDESRPYQPGDDIRSLDWKVTARTNKPHTKQFREERERPVIIAVDFRSTMFFATRGYFKSVIAAKSAALLAWRATQQGDRLGGFIFSEQDHWEWRPTLRAGATLHFLEQLARRSRVDQHAEQHSTPDCLRNELARLRRVARPGSLLVLISDFRGLDEQAQSHLAQTARHNDVVLVFVYDALETQLPPAGHYRIAHQHRELTLETHDKARRDDYAARFTAREEQLKRLCHRQRMVFVSCATHQDPLTRLQQGMLSKAR